MMDKVIVFDFDKTLSYKDSLVEIFKSEMVGSKFIFRPIYFMIQVVTKLGLLSRETEKSLMIKALFQNNETSFIRACHRYAERKDLNPIYNTFIERSKTDARVVVLSASAQYFLEHILREVNDIEIIGTTFSVHGGVIDGIVRHPSGRNKRKILDDMGILVIDECYYDSKSDECLLPISKSYYRIKNGKIIESHDE